MRDTPKDDMVRSSEPHSTLRVRAMIYGATLHNFLCTSNVLFERERIFIFIDVPSKQNGHRPQRAWHEVTIGSIPWAFSVFVTSHTYVQTR